MSGAPIALVAGGSLGRRLAERLAGDAPIERLRAGALDGHAPTETLVYAPPAAGGIPDGEDLARLLAALRAGAVVAGGHLVLISSARVHQPHYRHPGHVAEDRLAHRRPANAVAHAWRRLERVVTAAAEARGVTLTVLRPTTVLDGGDQLGRRFGRRIAVTVAGHDPSLQLLDPADLAEAVAAAAKTRRAGTFHIAPAGVVPLRRALRLAGVRRLPLPWWLHRLGHRGDPGTSPSAADRSAYLRYSWTVDGSRARRDLALAPARSSLEALARAMSASGDRTDSATDVPCDDFGLDRAYVAAFGRTLFRFLHDVYWRIEVRGLEHVPRTGGAVLAGCHRGFMPWDGVMVLHLLARELGRHPRFLIHPALIKFPFLANYMTKLGGVVACRENADRLLARGALLGFFPEGIQGAFSLYRDAYRLRRFGRGSFTRWAIHHQVPIVPFVTVGSAETFPIIRAVRWRRFERWSEWPFLPLTTPLPLPAKWHTRFLAPIDVAGAYAPADADDPARVQALSQRVRAAMAAAIADMRARRKSIFRGDIWRDGEER